MLKEELSSVFTEIAELLELQNENPFKIRAYIAAAHTLANYEADLEAMAKQDKLTEITGIGEVLAAKIKEYLDTGKISFHEKLKADTPVGLLEMLQVPGLGPKKIYVIHNALGVTTLGELEYACLENRLKDLPGFGLKTQEKILHGLNLLKSYRGKHLYDDALQVGEELLTALQPYATDLSLAGSLRRFKEIVKDIDIVATGIDIKKLIETFVSHPLVKEVIQQGDNKASVETKAGINVDLLVVASHEYPFALHHFTGSKEHNVAMRSLAKSMGLKINEYGVFKGEQLLGAKNEAEFFGLFGLDFIPPELREGIGEVELAQSGNFPNLITAKDILGVFHTHTSYSDGISSLSEMKEAAKALGLKYLAISDHSQSAAYAGGLKSERLLQQIAEIDAINQQDPDFTILKGIESDILADGSLDYPDDILAQCDFVIGSVHSKFNLSEAEMTKRIAKALSNKYLSILGHPTGRLLLARDAYPINMEEILQVAAANHKIIEINANPHRLDMDWHWCRRAKELGIKIAISPDAHRSEDLSYYHYGILVARKAGLTKTDIINTFSAEDVLEYFRN